MNKRIKILFIFSCMAICALYLFRPQHETHSEKDMIGIAKDQISELNKALELFKADLGFYPMTQDGLEALVVIPAQPPKRWNGPYLKLDVIPLDPWGNEYRYVCPGVHNPQTFDLTSAGPDGQYDTPDDLTNYPLNAQQSPSPRKR